MTRIAAILLLGIFSFNIFGYQLVADYLEKRTNAGMEHALDADQYKESDLILIKTPTDLPYYSNSSSFQRVDGEIEIAGVYYKYVKCRIYNDSLELLCIPNKGKMKIEEARDGFSRLAADVQQTGDHEKSLPYAKSFHKALSEFEVANQPVTSRLQVSLQHNFPSEEVSFLNSLFILSVEQPPDTSVLFSA